MVNKNKNQNKWRENNQSRVMKIDGRRESDALNEREPERKWWMMAEDIFMMNLFRRNWIDLVAEHVGLVLAEDCTLQSGMCNPRKSSMAPRRPALTMTNRRESSFRWNEIRKRRTCSGGRIFGGVKKETRWMADRAALIEFFRHCFAPGFDWNVHRVN